MAEQETTIREILEKLKKEFESHSPVYFLDTSKKRTNDDIFSIKEEIKVIKEEIKKENDRRKKAINQNNTPQIFLLDNIFEDDIEYGYLYESFMAGLNERNKRIDVLIGALVNEHSSAISQVISSVEKNDDSLVELIKKLKEKYKTKLSINTLPQEVQELRDNLIKLEITLDKIEKHINESKIHLANYLDKKLSVHANIKPIIKDLEDKIKKEQSFWKKPHVGRALFISAFVLFQSVVFGLFFMYAKTTTTYDPSSSPSSQYLSSFIQEKTTSPDEVIPLLSKKEFVSINADLLYFYFAFLAVSLWIARSRRTFQVPSSSKENEGDF